MIYRQMYGYIVHKYIIYSFVMYSLYLTSCWSARKPNFADLHHSYLTSIRPAISTELTKINFCCLLRNR